MANKIFGNGFLRLIRETAVQSRFDGIAEVEVKIYGNTPVYFLKGTQEEDFQAWAASVANRHLELTFSSGRDLPEKGQDPLDFMRRQGWMILAKDEPNNGDKPNKLAIYKKTDDSGPSLNITKYTPLPKEEIMQIAAQVTDPRHPGQSTPFFQPVEPEPEPGVAEYRKLQAMPIVEDDGRTLTDWGQAIVVARAERYVSNDNNFSNLGDNLKWMKAVREEFGVDGVYDSERDPERAAFDLLVKQASEQLDALMSYPRIKELTDPERFVPPPWEQQVQGPAGAQTSRMGATGVLGTDSLAATAGLKDDWCATMVGGGKVDYSAPPLTGIDLNGMTPKAPVV